MSVSIDKMSDLFCNSKKRSNRCSIKKIKKTEVGESALFKELQLNGCVALKEAIKKFNISEATDRRLFTRIESKGLLIRSHGKISLQIVLIIFITMEREKNFTLKKKADCAGNAKINKE